jgi:hypothetical protein
MTREALAARIAALKAMRSVELIQRAVDLGVDITGRETRTDLAVKIVEAERRVNNER